MRLLDLLWRRKYASEFRITRNQFTGHPPKPFATWIDYFADALTRGELSGLHISAVDPTQSEDIPRWGEHGVEFIVKSTTPERGAGTP